jgi:hypothetical protein
MQVLDTAYEPTISNCNILDPAASGHYSAIHIVADSNHRLQQIPYYTTSTSTRACTSICCRCHPALLIGSNAFSKPVHIATNLSKKAFPLRESSPLLDESPATGTGPLQFVPHYCALDVCTNELDAQRAPTRLQIEPAANNINAASNCRSSAVHEAAAAQTVTMATNGEEDTPVGGNDCTVINVVTLCNIWRLISTATDSHNGRDSTDDLFMIPIEESLIGQQSDLHELVID